MIVTGGDANPHKQTKQQYSSCCGFACPGILSTYGLPATISGCSTDYGPYHFPEKLILLTIVNTLAGKELPVYGAGLNVRD